MIVSVAEAQARGPMIHCCIAYFNFSIEKKGEAVCHSSPTSEVEIDIVFILMESTEKPPREGMNMDL